MNDQSEYSKTVYFEIVTKLLDDFDLAPFSFNNKAKAFLDFIAAGIMGIHHHIAALLASLFVARSQSAGIFKGIFSL
jgi:hypothetical protein